MRQELASRPTKPVGPDDWTDRHRCERRRRVVGNGDCAAGDEPEVHPSPGDRGAVGTEAEDGIHFIYYIDVYDIDIHSQILLLLTEQ